MNGKRDTACILISIEHGKGKPYTHILFPFHWMHCGIWQINNQNRNIHINKPVGLFKCLPLGLYISICGKEFDCVILFEPHHRGKFSKWIFPLIQNHSFIRFRWKSHNLIILLQRLVERVLLQLLLFLPVLKYLFQYHNSTRPKRNPFGTWVFNVYI